MFLDAPQLKKLTGYVLPSRQIKWLEEHGYPHDVNAAGHPVVLVDAVRARHGLTNSDSLISWEKVA